MATAREEAALGENVVAGGDKNPYAALDPALRAQSPWRRAEAPRTKGPSPSAAVGLGPVCLLDGHDAATQEGIYKESPLARARLGVAAPQTAKVPGAQLGGVSKARGEELSNPTKG